MREIVKLPRDVEGDRQRELKEMDIFEEKQLSTNDKNRLEKIAIYEKLRSLRSGTVYKLLTSDLPEIQYYIEGVIPKMQIACFYGPLEQFKSSLCLYFAICLASGAQTFHYKTNKHCNVLWIDEEMGVIGLKDKISKLVKGLQLGNKSFEGNFIYESINGFKLDNSKSVERLKALIVQ